MNTKHLILIILLFILILTLAWVTINNNIQEKFNQTYGRPIDLLYKDIPPGINKLPGTYITYENINLLKELCPNSFTKTQFKPCETKNDCAPAEVCVYDGYDRYCQCSIVNACLYDSVC